ncbi:hypothetical protein R1sor_011694 [Riccia sorocarpa]|uniref:Uncharacterized protein n=1 Tax=Riccia sorocarpa TaxID=122646 RepID=A0ABD3I1L7_9MARC
MLVPSRHAQAGLVPSRHAEDAAPRDALSDAITFFFLLSCLLMIPPCKRFFSVDQYADEISEKKNPYVQQHKVRVQLVFVVLLNCHLCQAVKDIR